MIATYANLSMLGAKAERDKLYDQLQALPHDPAKMPWLVPAYITILAERNNVTKLTELIPKVSLVVSNMGEQLKTIAGASPSAALQILQRVSAHRPVDHQEFQPIIDSMYSDAAQDEPVDVPQAMLAMNVHPARDQIATILTWRLARNRVTRAKDLLVQASVTESKWYKEVLLKAITRKEGIVIAPIIDRMIEMRFPLDQEEAIDVLQKLMEKEMNVVTINVFKLLKAKQPKVFEPARAAILSKVPEPLPAWYIIFALLH